MKYTKQNANYHLARAENIRICRTCNSYNRKWKVCSKVQGIILPEYTCKYWSVKHND